MNVYYKISLSAALLFVMTGPVEAQHVSPAQPAHSLPIAQKTARQWFRFVPYSEARNGTQQAPAALKNAKVATIAQVSDYADPIRSISDIGFWNAPGENEPGLFGKDTYVTVSLPDLSHIKVAPEALRLIGWDGKEWHSLGNTGASGLKAGSTLSGTINTDAIQKIGIGSVTKALPIETQVALATVSPCQSTFLGTVTSITGRIWLDRNLGAQRAAISFNDHVSYGGLFQWGRMADGHECINWTSATTGTPVYGTTATKALTDDPGHNMFIVFGASGYNQYEWSNPPNNDRWQASTGLNNPCPLGYRLPTWPEWQVEMTYYTNFYTAPMRMPMVPLRLPGGAISEGFSNGTYWSATQAPGLSSAKMLSLTAGAVAMAYGWNITGHAVRCIKN